MAEKKLMEKVVRKVLHSFPKVKTNVVRLVNNQIYFIKTLFKIQKFSLMFFHMLFPLRRKKNFFSFQIRIEI